MAKSPDFLSKISQLEAIRRDAERVHDNQDSFVERIIEATFASANLALRTAVLVNGGAAVAMLAYVGSLNAKDAALVAGSLIWFAWGVAAALAGMLLAYFTNFSNMRLAQSFHKIWEHPYSETG